eukprot:CAMPEP_0201140206 /NCGR_PEP_ID=MMETSP0851-20130426/1747_1 /ASSEMBLY_ACC=CAM_ASM_000631 /TAXON_ID=183588 /ORGANISM="Pseudo-nitzschia fraudulenta, Strain WWA7" /LENGTH=95 /DNA_ID=CAMNT_0047412595 /DNA_START=227 /DNA_END=514 /DNA_ORIENTATION=-
MMEEKTAAAKQQQRNSNSGNGSETATDQRHNQLICHNFELIAATTAADRSAATAVEGGSVTMEHQHHSNGTEANCSSSSETKPTIALMRQSRSTT